MDDRLHLRILPVYSELHASQVQGAIRLLKHQAETLAAFGDPDIDVIFNTAMTGDGKSLAAYLPSFRDGLHVVAMYPTNELVRDQEQALKLYQQRLQLRLPRHDTMYSDRITRLVREHDSTRVDEIRKLVMNNGILLTNPDLVHLIMGYRYGWGYVKQELAVDTAMNFDYFLFDEFHVFGVPQVVAVTNMLGYLATSYANKPAQRKKFVFLSATPTPLLTTLLQRSGLRCCQITGNYRSVAADGYRCILQPCELELHEVSQEAPTEQWIEAHAEEILTFFKQYPTSRAAILVSSVATARRLVKRLTAFFAPHGITVGENTGLTGTEEKEESFKRHILVGTSTVDVGIDFHINYLVFEAFESGTFLQRFGRLGRHDEFPAYRAYALIPRFVRERLSMQLVGKEEIEREQLNTLVREAFPTEQQFMRYSKHWGSVQAAQLLVELQQVGSKGQDENSAFTAALAEHYERLYGDKTKKPAMPTAIKKYWALKNKAPQVLRELESFRGQSPLSCGVWDTDGHLQIYDLFFLLTNAEFEVLDRADFMREVQRQGLEERDFVEQLLYLKIHDYIPERLKLALHLQQNLTGRLHTLQICSGFYVEEPRHTWLDQVNRALKRLKLPCVISDMPRQELRGRLQLNMLFPVYRLRDDTGYEYSIAFGQEALLLETELKYYKNKDDKAIMA